jgi:carboxymethylenebutenolidase
MLSSWQSVNVGGADMRAYVSVPDGSGPFPGIVVIQAQNGVDRFIEEATRILAADGFVAAAPDLYHRDGPDCKDDGPTRRMRLRDNTVIQDVNATAEFLKAHNQVDARRLGIVGFCMGGRVTYLMAAASSHFKAAVKFYGGNIMRPWGDGPSPFERTANIQCPLQGHFGEEDENPSLADMRKFDEELTRLGKEHEFYTYPGAGHAFANIGQAQYRKQAADAAWARTLKFFAQHLNSETAVKAAAGR